MCFSTARCQRAKVKRLLRGAVHRQLHDPLHARALRLVHHLPLADRPCSRAGRPSPRPSARRRRSPARRSRGRPTPPPLGMFCGPRPVTRPDPGPAADQGLHHLAADRPARARDQDHDVLLLAEDLRQLRRRRDLELVVAAVRGRLVGPPAQEDRRRGGSGRPAGGRTSPRRRARCAAAPRTGPCPRSSGSAPPGMRVDRRPSPRPLPPRMPGQRVLAQRLQLLRQLRAHGHRERRGHAHVVQRAPRRRRGRAAASPPASPGPFLCQRKPATTQSAVRDVLDLDHRRACPAGRASSRAWRSRRRARRPRSDGTSPAATPRSRVQGVRWTRPVAPASAFSSAARRSAWGRPRRSSSPRASRSKATNEDGVSAASFATRDAAGCRRSCSSVEVEAAVGRRSRSRRPPRSARAGSPAAWRGSSGK